MGKQVLPLEAAAFSIFQLVTKSDESSEKRLVELQVPKNRGAWELYHLRTFGGEVAIIKGLTDPTREKVMTLFLGHLKQIGVRAGLSEETWRQEFVQRRQKYAPAVNTPHQNGPGWQAGKVFSELCGSDMDVAVVMIGVVEFTAAVKFAGEFIESVTITD